MCAKDEKRQIKSLCQINYMLILVRRSEELKRFWLNFIPNANFVIRFCKEVIIMVSGRSLSDLLWIIKTHQIKVGCYRFRVFHGTLLVITPKDFLTPPQKKPLFPCEQLICAVYGIQSSVCYQIIGIIFLSPCLFFFTVTP